MRLTEQDDPLRTWEYAERYLGVGTRTYSPFAADLDISPGCHPLLGHESFMVPSFWVTDEQGSYLRNGLPSTLHDLYQQPGAFLLPVHPDALEHEGLVGREALLGCKPGPFLEAVPSANARTVFVRRFDGAAVPPHFAQAPLSPADVPLHPPAAPAHPGASPVDGRGAGPGGCTGPSRGRRRHLRLGPAPLLGRPPA